MDWLYHNLATALLILGGMLIAFGALGDTIRGWMKRKDGRRRRSPKCWYDLRHTDGLRCPECGHAAKRERSLRKGRWGKRWIALGALLMLVSHPVDRIPAAMHHGSAALAPDWLIVALLPWYDDTPSSPTAYSRNTWPFAELDRRIKAKELGSFGEWLWLKRAFAGDGRRALNSQAWSETYGDRIRRAIRSGRISVDAYREWIARASPIVGFGERSTWPERERYIVAPFAYMALTDEPLAYTVRRTGQKTILQSGVAFQSNRDGGMLINYGNDVDPSHIIDLGVLPPGVNEIPLTVTFHEFETPPHWPDFTLGRVVSRIEHTLTVKVAGTIDQHLKLIDDSPIAPFLESCREAVYSPNWDSLLISPGLHYQFNVRQPDQEVDIAWRVELLKYDETIATSFIDADSRDWFDNARLNIPFEDVENQLRAAALANERGWSVRLVPDPALALGTGRTSIISETITLPVRWIDETIEDQQEATRRRVEAGGFDHLRAIVYHLPSPSGYDLKPDEKLLVVAILDPSRLQCEAPSTSTLHPVDALIDLITHDGRSLEQPYDWSFVVTLSGLSFVDFVLRDVDDETVHDVTYVRLRFPDYRFDDEPPTPTELRIPVLPPDTPMPWKWRDADDDE